MTINATQDGPEYDVIQGTISALGQSVTLPCRGSTTALITVEGTFHGTLYFSGQAVEGGAAIPRTVAKVSTGSLGIWELTFNGTVSDQFRTGTGGASVTVSASSWVSGTANITISSSESPAIITMNGPVHITDEQALRGGRAFLATPGAVAVTAGQQLYLILTNPANSGVNLFLTERRFGSNQTSSSAPLEYQAFRNPTAILSTTGSVVNRHIGGPSSQAVFTYQAGTVTMGGTQTNAGPVNQGGGITSIPYSLQISPGSSLGFSINGGGQNIQQAARLYATLLWFEETYYG